MQYICTTSAYANTSYFEAGRECIQFCLVCPCATITLKDMVELLLLQIFDPCCLNCTHFAFHSDMFSLKTSAMQCSFYSFVESLPDFWC